MKSLPTIEFLRECFDYRPERGELRWKRRPREHFVGSREWSRWNTRYAETVAGMTAERSIKVKINAVKYRVHRIIFKLVTGKDPEATVDHKSGSPFDNKQDNLRSATMQEQSWNRKLVKNNTSGHRGVHWHKKDKKWHATIGHNGVKVHLGRFDAAEEASAVYEAKARELRGEFYRMVI